MSTHAKLLIPLIDKSITLDDIDKENGFVNAYLRNKNKPYIDNCIFLLYDPSVHNKNTEEREYKFTKISSFYGKDYVRINGVYYNIYMFIITNSDAKKLLNGYRHEKISTFTRICLFWNGTDEMVNKYLSDLLPALECNWEEVPEEDVYTSIGEDKQKNPGGLAISPWIFCFYYNL